MPITTLTDTVLQVVRRGLPGLRHSGGDENFSSASYWEQRYAGGGHSGGGSYDQLAQFKAEVLNALVVEEGFASVIEFGCGDGNQLSLAEYPSYMGLDVSSTAVRMCTDRFATDETKSFYLYDPHAFTDRAHRFRADLAMSLDVIFHLVEDEVFDTYMRHLFAAAKQSVVVYSSNDDSRTDPAVHVRHRRFTDWVDAQMPAWKLERHVPNPHTDLHDAVADFYIFRPA